MLGVALITCFLFGYNSTKLLDESTKLEKKKKEYKMAVMQGNIEYIVIHFSMSKLYSENNEINIPDKVKENVELLFRNLDRFELKINENHLLHNEIDLYKRFKSSLIGGILFEIGEILKDNGGYNEDNTKIFNYFENRLYEISGELNP